MSVQTECRTWKLVFESYAEVQPDFTVGNVSANRMQNLKTRFRKLCWGAAWLHRRQCQCKPNAELENSFSKVMLRCSLTSRQQRYNTRIPKPQFFDSLISHLESFLHLRMSIQPFIYGYSCAFSVEAIRFDALSTADHGAETVIEYQLVPIQSELVPS